MLRAPLFPELAYPVLSATRPLDKYASSLRTLTDPLLEPEAPPPLTTDTEPPVFEDEMPALMTTSPPMPLSEDPTVT